MIKEILEAALEAELQDHLSSDASNRKNGKSKKVVKSDYGSIALENSRDRNGNFEPKIVKKRQRTLGGSLDKKILALWSKGMSYSDIRSHIEDILIACIDNLSGFKEAITSVFPHTEIQQCIVHQVRNSLRYVPEKEKKAFMSDLKSVYKDDTFDLAEHHLLELSET